MSLIPDNLDTALPQAIQQAPKSIAEEKKQEQMRRRNVPVVQPDREDATDFGMNNLGQLIYVINPNKDVRKKHP